MTLKLSKNIFKLCFAAGIIREFESPFSSSIVDVRKKNGDVKLGVDY